VHPRSPPWKRVIACQGNVRPVVHLGCVQFVTVEEGVRLEVLDWGGTGRPVVLLAGLGFTAHVFDGFAEKLTESYHVYGITRRGYGASSQSASGYTGLRRTEDDLRVFDALKLVAPVIVGHSVAGDELSQVGIHHYERIGGLVYLDALHDGTDDWTDYDALCSKLPEVMQRPPTPSPSDLKSRLPGRLAIRAAHPLRSRGIRNGPHSGQPASLAEALAASEKDCC